ncbi:rhodanese-like domain-containing protein [Gracilimonas mengyeensis]|uniref:Phage shock protein E n=1 Tax=Gracilimonas mengyeensis TaxID=1302730 RepID=A0A521F8E4_9BACT|nr:rhodanese-like domain-containing protein [Gracilimonas mengyeensis]SMO91881.1 phage shock protein E [Gracilimonas mengyeensis]
MKKPILLAGIFLIAGFGLFTLLNNQTEEKGTQSMSIDISTEEFKEKRANHPGVIIDVRTEGEFEEGHLAEVDHQYDLMNGDFKAQLDELPKDKTYYLYCRSGNRSGQAARMMKDAGFENVFNVGGFEELAKAGFETKK